MKPSSRTITTSIGQNDRIRPQLGIFQTPNPRNFQIPLTVTAHVQKNDKNRRSNLDGRTKMHSGYAISLSRRWLTEKTFSWLK